MKAEKFALDWKSLALGMALCLALVVFAGSMAQGNQAENRIGPTTQKTRTANEQGIVQNMVTMNDLMAKCELIDQRILIVEGKINRLQEGLTDALKTLEMLWNRGEKK